MRFSRVLWVFLIVVGLFGALSLSAIFFGFFAVGLFLVLDDIIVKRKKPPLTTQPSPTMPLLKSINPSTLSCPNCGGVLEAQVAFCPQCGEKVMNK